MFSGWFGIRKNFCQFLLSALPFLQEYGNISYHSSDAAAQQDRESTTSSIHTGSNVLVEFEKHDKRGRKLQKNKKLDPVVPIISIDLPD